MNITLYLLPNRNGNFQSDKTICFKLDDHYRDSFNTDDSQIAKVEYEHNNIHTSILARNGKIYSIKSKFYFDIDELIDYIKRNKIDS